MRRITGFHRTTIMQFEWRRFSRQNRRQVEQVGNHLKVDKAQRSCDYWGITGNPRWLSPSARNLARQRGGLTLFSFPTLCIVTDPLIECWDDGTTTTTAAAHGNIFYYYFYWLFMPSSPKWRKDQGARWRWRAAAPWKKRIVGGATVANVFYTTN